MFAASVNAAFQMIFIRIFNLRQAWLPFFLNSGNFSRVLRVLLSESGSPNKMCPPRRASIRRKKEHTMVGELIGLVAVTLGMGVPLGALYTYYRVRKLRSEERLAAIARGVTFRWSLN